MLQEMLLMGLFILLWFAFGYVCGQRLSAWLDRE